MPITALYASALTALFVYLSGRVIAWRRTQRVEIGDGADRELLRRMRVHANFVEYTPFFLVLMGLAESLASPKIILHAMGAVFVAGRLMHAYALSQTPHVLKMRVAGMVLSLNTLIFGACLCVVMALTRGGIL
jgi:uncharacterized protein